MKPNAGSRKLKILFILVPLIFLAAGCTKKAPVISPPAVSEDTAVAIIGGHALDVQIAETVEDQARGLSGRDSLPENSGMLFLFTTPSRVAFWMKDTLIPLDFIWVKDGKVVEITKNVQPEPNVADASLRRYLPGELIDSTIEVNAGWTDKNEIKAGDSVKLK